MIDLLFLAHNRLEFTKAAVEAMLANTDWSQVQFVRVHDDVSTDGAREYLQSVKWPVPCEFRLNKVGGPVAAMNQFIRECAPQMFCKIDSDVLLPPDWLGECLEVMSRCQELDLLGIECGNDNPVGGQAKRGYEKANHIGGIGLMSSRAFKGRPLPQADGRFGFTQWQEFHEGVRKGWLSPALPVALLDHLPMEPWRSLSEEYIAKGWQRRGWGEGPEQYYGAKSSKLWDWWAGARQETPA